MKLLPILLLALTLLNPGASLADTTNTATQAPSLIPALQACPATSAPRFETAQVSQDDCCKGHKGVCGCRAGKIVCCDNSISLNCTCHSDWGIAN